MPFRLAFVYLWKTILKDYLRRPSQKPISKGYLYRNYRDCRLFCIFADPCYKGFSLSETKSWTFLFAC